MEKTFILTVKIEENNTPQNWEFENVNQIEQLALWLIVKNLAEVQINKMLGNK